ncbi:MAG: hypothetical protein ACRDZO_20985 [Egibacteraceae bacterium]
MRTESRAPTSMPRKRWRWTLPVLRCAAALQALLVVWQAFLAGAALGGSSAALALHEQIGTERVTLASLIVLVLAVMAWRRGRAPGWPALVALGTVAVLYLQIDSGFAGTLDVHLPLGVTIFGANLAIAMGARPARS